jgi:hypothetical protein
MRVDELPTLFLHSQGASVKKLLRVDDLPVLPVALPQICDSATSSMRRCSWTAQVELD